MESPLDPSDAERFLRRNLPLAEAVGVTVTSLDVSSPEADGVVLGAPLEPNLNHLGTAFGGSLATLAIIAGWANVHFRLHALGIVARTVIQRSSMEYVAPALSGLRASCSPFVRADWQKFIRGLERHGKARMNVHVVIESDGGVVATFVGSYVAIGG